MAGLRLINPLYTAGCRGDFVIVGNKEYRLGRVGAQYARPEEEWERKARAKLPRPQSAKFRPQPVGENGEWTHITQIFVPPRRPRGPQSMTQERMTEIAIAPARRQLKACRPHMTRPLSANLSRRDFDGSANATLELRGALRQRPKSAHPAMRRSASAA